MIYHVLGPEVLEVCPKKRWGTQSIRPSVGRQSLDVRTNYACDVGHGWIKNRLGFSKRRLPRMPRPLIQSIRWLARLPFSPSSYSHPIIMATLVPTIGAR